MCASNCILQNIEDDNYINEIFHVCCQGYMTILTEFVDQVGASSTPPTHVFLQAGVGSFSGE